MAHVSLDNAAIVGEEAATDVVTLDDAMDALARLDPRKVRVVEMRFFGGLSVDKTAAVLNVSPGTVMRDWSSAKANGTHSRLSLRDRDTSLHSHSRAQHPTAAIYCATVFAGSRRRPCKREQLAADDSRKRMVHRGTETDDQAPFHIRKSRCHYFRSEPPPG